MNFRKVQLAWSVAWGMMAILLVVLWERSYRHTDVLNFDVRFAETHSLIIESVTGRVIAFAGPFSFYHHDSWPADRDSKCRIQRVSVLDSIDRRFINLPSSKAISSFYFFRSGSVPARASVGWPFVNARGPGTRGVYLLAFPHWLIVAICAVFTTVLWVRTLNWRFSVRTLLIALTLAAVSLGLLGSSLGD